MAKQVVRSGREKDDRPGSKAQQQFNLLTLRIPQLRREIQELEEVSVKLQQRVATEFDPLMRKYALLQADLVRLWDKAYDSGFFRALEKKKLEQLILNTAYELITEQALEDLKPIYDKYSDVAFDHQAPEPQLPTPDKIRALIREKFGLDIDEDVDLSTPEKIRAFLEEHLARAEAHIAEKSRPAEEPRAERPKTARELARERQKAEEERHIAHSVRAVYMDLVKAFHPDRERDEAEKARKTAIMQRVTAAYEAKDLMTLLQLQLEFEQIDPDHLESLAAERLKYFNKILSRQVQELEDVLQQLRERLAAATNQLPIRMINATYLEYQLDRDLKTLKKQIRQLEQDLRDWSDPRVLKGYLDGFVV